MINLIGAFITTILLAAFILHRPPVQPLEEELDHRSYFRWIMAAIGALLPLHYLLPFLLGHSWYRPFFWIEYVISTLTLWFHEGGHIYWMWGGKFLHVAGGTLNEIVIPLLWSAYCIKNRSPRLALLGIYWIGLNCFGISRYMADARAQALPLLGGHGIHDWNYMLSTLGLLSFDTILSTLVWLIGILLIAVSLILFSIEHFSLRALRG